MSESKVVKMSKEQNKKEDNAQNQQPVSSEAVYLLDAGKIVIDEQDTSHKLFNNKQELSDYLKEKGVDISKVKDKDTVAITLSNIGVISSIYLEGRGLIVVVDENILAISQMLDGIFTRMSNQMIRNHKQKE